MTPRDPPQTPTDDRSAAAALPGSPTPREPGHWAMLDGPDREAFLGILSHELRTPVTTIYGGAHLLATKDLAPDRRRALAADVRGEADRLYRVVEDLVILARSSNDGLRPADEPVAVGRLVVAAIEYEVERRPGLVVRLLGSPDAVADDADEGFVAHILRNLLENAARHGGTSGPIEVIVAGSADEVTVRVTDRGAIPPSSRDAFGGSSEAPVGAADRAVGGLGLYVARRLTEAMHGRMWTRQTEPKGAEVGFALPGSGLDSGSSAGSGPGPERPRLS